MPDSENGAVLYEVLDSENCNIPWSLRLQGTSYSKLVFPQLGSVGEIIRSITCSGETIDEFGWRNYLKYDIL